MEAFSPLRKHLVFIVNPHSGVDRVKSIRQGVEGELDHKQYTYEIQYTQRKGHGESIAREAAQNNAYAVIAVGGDGSVNDVIRGLYGSPTKLGIIPKGSGNGLARSLGIPLTVHGAISCINQNKCIQIDLVKAHDQLSASNSGVGFDALVCRKFAKSKRRGLLSYISIINRLLWRYSCVNWKIETVDLILEQKAFLVNIANGRQFGYNFIIAENASWTDGQLDIVVINKFPKVIAALLAWRMMRGTLAKSRYVQHFRANKVRVSTQESIKWMQVDGESTFVDANTIDFEILPLAISVLTP